MTYEFFRYHALAPWTGPNIIAATYGTTSDLMTRKKRIETFAREKGYVTGYTHDFCHLFHLDHDYKRGFHVDEEFEDETRLDHEFVYHGCDYNNLPVGNPLSFLFTKGPYTASRKCFLNRDLTDYSFDYTLQFFRTYKDERKYFTVRMIDPHEFSEEVAGFFDDPLSVFVQKMIDEGHMDNTIVSFYSDHGDHMEFLLTHTESYNAEKFNPFLIYMIPRSQKDKYSENIQSNQQRVLTPKDLYTTDIKYLEVVPDHPIEGMSILQDKISHRECDFMFVGQCMCKR